MIGAAVATLLWKLIPLYVIIGLGFLSSRYLRIDSKSVANLAIYTITPVVIFSGLIKNPLQHSFLLLPFISFGIAALISVLTFFIAKRYWHDGAPYLLGLSSGTGNTGYFGIPLLLAFLGSDLLPMYLCIIPGITLFESTLGYYFISRGQYSQKESVKRVLKLPFLYAFIFGITGNLLGYTLPAPLLEISDKFLGCYTVLGMMLVGMGLSTDSKLSFDIPYLAAALLLRFLVWPVTVIGLIALDNSVFHLFGTQEHCVFLLASAVPIAANVVAYAAQNSFQVSRAATSVIISTLVSPVIIWFLLAIFK
jgi:predicted permease